MSEGMDHGGGGEPVGAMSRMDGEERDAGDAAGRSGREWTLESRECVHDQVYRIERLTLRHTLYAGGLGEPVRCEMFSRGDVVGVLPYDPVLDRVLLVEQFRAGAIGRPEGPWQREIVAGRLEPGETPERAAHREVREEAGLTLVRLEPISRYLPSPGASADEVFVYLGECDLSEAGGRHGLSEEGEDILASVVAAERAIAMLATGAIRSAVSIVALQWLALRRLGAVTVE